MISLQEMSMLTTLYTQPHRYYHNINHINDCLVELENFVHRDFDKELREAVETAIWYHDAVYNPYSRYNEYNSWKLAEQMGHEQSVICCITHTRMHLDHIDWSNQSTLIKKYQLPIQIMLDIDLAGFGQETGICLEHGLNVRKEYYKTSEYDFAVGRLRFIVALQMRESLYYTDYFKEKYHVQSQKNLNLEAEIALETIDEYSGM